MFQWGPGILVARKSGYEFTSRSYNKSLFKGQAIMFKFLKNNFIAITVTLILVLGVGSIISSFFDKGSKGLVDVTLPNLTPQAVAGKKAFDTNCAQCHGVNGSGTEKGPPLIHNIYNPGHHGDQSFLLAAKRGVRSHHWKFGDMPPLPNVKNKEITDIVAFIREVQRANGITYKEHQM